ncbi:Trp biosynthesis-associated membrane protein [Actinokineospora sp.]|uniref:Trp biosynthesis-associated membrane protein n=1 Tax=Actinokineospora sp. TaxID=1872133 RepID=UPI003D6A6641
MNAKRPLWTVCLLLALAALSLWGSSRLGWGTDSRLPPGRAFDIDAYETVPVVGADMLPALVPLALFSLAAIAAAIALGGWARVAVGGLVALLGLVPLILPLGGDPLLWGRALAVTGGALMVAAGLLLVVRGRRMPRLGSKYRTPKAANESNASEPDLWRALSEGDDPTARES